MGRKRAMTKLELDEYLTRAIRSFQADPPDTPFQRGYLSALIEIGKASAALTPEQCEVARALLYVDPASNPARAAEDKLH